MWGSKYPILQPMSGNHLCNIVIVSYLVLSFRNYTYILLLWTYFKSSIYRRDKTHWLCASKLLNSLWKPWSPLILLVKFKFSSCQILPAEKLKLTEVSGSWVWANRWPLLLSDQVTSLSTQVVSSLLSF